MSYIEDMGRWIQSFYKVLQGIYATPLHENKIPTLPENRTKHL
jgi:hypothetical protein